MANLRPTIQHKQAGAEKWNFLGKASVKSSEKGQFNS